MLAHDFDVAVVLGSGLGGIAASLSGTQPIPYADVGGLATPGVPGHEGSLYPGELEGVAVLFFAGRVHLYEGRTAQEVTKPVRRAVEAGCRTVILTNAAGGIRPSLEIGSPCLISDHLNLTGHNPLVGLDSQDVFLDLSNVYDADLRAAAREIDGSLQEGVYAGLVGPTYETPAEIRMLRTLGADLVGMSTVLEAIAAHHLGARVLGISVVTNRAAGLAPDRLTHTEVAARSRVASARLEAILRGVIAGSAG